MLKMVEGAGDEMARFGAHDPAGDEVIFVLGCLLFLFLLSLFYLWKQRDTIVQENRSLLLALQEIKLWLSRTFWTGTNDRSSDGANSAEQPSSGTISDNAAGTMPQQRARTIYNADMICPICLNACRYAVLSNCGHAYCSQCFVAYWHHGTWLSAVACPVCRTQVTLLMPNFAEADISDSERTEALNNIRDYNRRFSNEPRSLIDYLRDIPVLVPHLMARLFSLNGLMLMFRIRIILLLFAAGVYILSPLDVLPEAIFGLFGLFDDLFIGVLLLVYLCVAYRQFLQT